MQLQCDEEMGDAGGSSRESEAKGGLVSAEERQEHDEDRLEPEERNEDVEKEITSGAESLDLLNNRSDEGGRVGALGATPTAALATPGAAPDKRSLNRNQRAKRRRQAAYKWKRAKQVEDNEVQDGVRDGAAAVGHVSPK